MGKIGHAGGRRLGIPAGEKKAWLEERKMTNHKKGEKN